jgi:hypothetical protein
MMGICVVDGIKYSFQRAPKLHSFRRYHLDSVGVDSVEGVVDNEAGAPLPLWDHSQRGQPEVVEILDQTIREDHPKTLLYKIQELGSDESQVVAAGLVGTSADMLGPFLGGPWRSGHNDRDARAFEGLK